MRRPHNGFTLQQGKRQRDHQRCGKLNRIGAAHITRPDKALLVQGARGDTEQCHHFGQQCERGDLHARAKLAGHHQQQTAQAKHQPQPLAWGDAGLA